MTVDGLDAHISVHRLQKQPLVPCGTRRCLMAKLSCCFGRRGVRGSAELSALVLWKAVGRG